VVEWRAWRVLVKTISKGGLIVGSIVWLAACGGPANGATAVSSPTAPTGSSATVTISYRASTRPRTDLPPSAQACIVGVGETHVHPSWGENYRALRASGAERWELTVNDAPVGPLLTLLVHDGNACDDNATGTVTRNVSVNDVLLTQIVSAPVLFPAGSAPEPGLAFSVSASGRVSP
jgi:hypothetical protein